MIDLMRLHVVWDENSISGARTGERISRHFDSIGMERDGVTFRVPVRFSSEPWDIGSPLPRQVDLTRATHNVIILLYDEEMYENRAHWNSWVSDLRARMDERAEQDVYVAFGSPDNAPMLSSDEARRTQYQRRDKWSDLTNDEACVQRLLLLLLIKVRAHLRTIRGERPKEQIFVSHAKVDGDRTARAIVEFINDTTDGVPIETFYDATELMPGDNFDERFKDAIAQGTLLAIISDVYDTRPWCVFELIEAKRGRRPIVLADIGSGRTGRTFPYGANLPRIRISPVLGSHRWIEALLVETMSEGLRCDLFEQQASAAAPQGALVLPRPPELFDVVHRDDLPDCIVYPDPPLGDIEADLLRRAISGRSPTTRLITLGEIE